MFCQNCGQQINSSVQTNNETDYSQLNNQIPTIKKDRWYYLGKIFGETREDVIRKTKRDGVILAVIVFILVLFPNNVLFSVFDESYKLSEPLDDVSTNFDKTIHSLNEAMLLYNTGEYDSCIQKTTSVSNDLDVLEGQIDDLNDMLDSTMMNRDKKRLCRDLLNNYKGSLEAQKQWSTYLEYAAKSAHNSDYSEANKYIHLVDIRIDDSNEHVDNIKEIVDELYQL
jgi:uncharacterized protein (UPF0332 family)